MEVWASPEATVARIDAGRSRDQLCETGHQSRESDIARIARLGVRATRYPVLWEKVAPDHPDARDYAWAERRLRALGECGVEPIVTLLHHGSGPAYTDLLDPEFPRLFADYAEATARRFPWVRRWTPINEPLTTARFSTLYGVWYPNLSDERAFGRALVHQTLAQQAAMARIRAVAPDAQFVFTEDLQRFAAGDDGVRPYVAFLRERMYLSVELVAGRVGAAHPLAAFLVDRCGVLPAELEAMCAGATPPDLVAFNHYPHSERYLFSAPDGSTGDVPAVYVHGEEPPRAAPLLWEAARRLQLPIALGEVHVRGSAAERVRWLAQHVDDANALRAAGVDLRAIGVWAAFGMTDWHSLLRADAGVSEDGIFTFAGATGTPQRTALADAVCELVRTGTVTCPPARGWWEDDARFIPPAAMLALERRGVPEGDHLVRGLTQRP